MSGFEDLAKWMEGFKSELDESSYQIIFTRLTGNHFKQEPNSNYFPLRKSTSCLVQRSCPWEQRRSYYTS